MVKLTGLARMLSRLSASDRDFLASCWANELQDSGQPCEFSGSGNRTVLSARCRLNAQGKVAGRRQNDARGDPVWRPRGLERAPAGAPRSLTDEPGQGAYGMASRTTLLTNSWPASMNHAV
jgi:hypothetical protein